MQPAGQRRFAPLVVGRLLRKTVHLMEGYDPLFLDDFAQMLGAAGIVRWMGQLAAVVKRAEQRYGTETTQYLAGVAAMWNGCGYCGVGHIYAANVQRHKDKGELSPIDEREVKALQHLDDRALLEELERRLTANGDSELWRLLERQYLLKQNRAEGETEDDPYLQAISACWDLVNECSIFAGYDLAPEQVPPLSGIARDKDAIARYRAAREQHQAAAS
jgi:hypothetical protein